MSFRFKQFFVEDSHCGMKVGTDGVLLGAWAFADVELPSDRAVDILDIGTGSGLLALMLAQRFAHARITAIDIDADAIAQATANFAASPWSDRLTAIHTSVQELSQQPQRFNLIICNPPYYDNSLRNPDPQRATARHTDTLTHRELFDCAARLLLPQGRFALIAPTESGPELLDCIVEQQLRTVRLTRVFSKPGKPQRRMLLELLKNYYRVPTPKIDDFYIESSDSPRSDQYKALTQDFYL